MKKKQRKNTFRAVLFIGTVVSLWFVPWPIVMAWLAPLPVSVQQQVDKAADYGFDGIIVYVDQKDSPAKWYTSGYKNRESKTPAEPHSLFKIASVGKLYTAVVIAKLIHSGRITMDQTLADHFPELAGRIENAETITLRMMVEHRSGIPNYTDINYYWAHPKQNDEERLALVLDLPALFAPGAEFSYCNTNYLLLSQLTERVTGEREFEYIRKNILDPLNLHNTYSSIHDVNPDDVMSGYYVGYENDLKTDDNGCMLATAEDLGKFLRALNDGSVFTDQKERDIYSSLYRYSHTGLIPGYQTIARYEEDLDAVVIQFTNTVDFEGYNWSMSEIMSNRIIDILEKQN